MRAMLLGQPGPVESSPLLLAEVGVPEPAADEVLVRVSACGICRTDLHVVEGELAPRRSPVIPGHQVVGTIARCGAHVKEFKAGERVGIAWLRQTCGQCVYCLSERENLCDDAQFNGYSADGGFAEFMTAPAQFVYALPDGFDDLQAAPLLCAGIIGYRCLRIAGVERGINVGFYGFGAAAHIAIQIARHWGAHVYVCSRDQSHQNLARKLGAEWAGGAMDPPPRMLDAAIIFAPAGELVPAALAAISKGGVVVLGGIHMSPIPAFPYALLYGERVVRSVMNNTRADGHEFLRLAAAIPIVPEVEVFSLTEANEALQQLKNDAVHGAGVLRI
jgi:alcohol dehydrogenase, propanol-preferring